MTNPINFPGIGTFKQKPSQVFPIIIKNFSGNLRQREDDEEMRKEEGSRRGIAQDWVSQLNWMLSSPREDHGRKAPFASYVIVFHQTNIKLNTKQTGPAQSF